MNTDSIRRAMAELIGTAILVATVVGSGIMATTLTDDLGLALLINAVSTVAALGVLIWTLGPISGAHFNPAVTMITALRREVRPAEAGRYVSAQLTGALLGVALANLMFDLPAWNVAATGRVEFGDAARRGRCDGGSVESDRGDHPQRACRTGAGAGAGVDRGGVLLHRLHVLRQSRCHDRAGVLGHVRRDRASLGAAVHRRAVGRGVGRCGAYRVLLPA